MAKDDLNLIAQVAQAHLQFAENMTQALLKAVQDQHDAQHKHLLETAKLCTRILKGTSQA